MRNIHELLGIIKGVNFDGVINQMEVARLQSWVDRNRNLATDKTQRNLIKMVDGVLEDKIITDDERALLLAESEELLKEDESSNMRIYELNGIIDGIICDGEVNEAEVYRLKEWMKAYGDGIRDYKPCKALCKAIDSILEDGVVTEEEQEQLLQMLTVRIGLAHVETKIDYLRKQVKARNNIGIDLIDILDNEDVIEDIHRLAEYQLSQALLSYSGSFMADPEIVVISLVLIAMMEYDGNFYENVRETYTDIYGRYTEQKVEGLIRYVLNRYRSEEEKSSRSRIINVVLSNAIVPSHFLAAFFEFIYDIYKLNFEYNLSDDLYEDFKFVYEGLENSMLSDGDDVQLNVTQKTYKLIRSTKQLIANDRYLDPVIRLSIMIVKLIDKKVWNKEVIIYNPYLKEGYKNWVKTLKDESVEGRHHRTSSEFRSRWEPKIILDSNQVYLVPPVHKVKAQHNYCDIRIVVLNGDNKIYENTKPDVREIIGGYQVSVNKIKIKNPLGKLSYRLMAGEEIVYDSKDKLYREFIVFASDGREIQNNSDYEGTAVFCYKNEHDRLKSFQKNEQYILASQNVKYADVIVIEDIVFNFSSLVRPGVFGDKYENYSLLRQSDDTKMPVYKKIRFLVFESGNVSSKYEIAINNSPYKLSDFHCTVSEREGVSKYVVDLDISVPSIYEISVNQLDAGKKNCIASFEIAYDPSLEVEDIKLDEATYMVSVKTDLSATTIIADIDVNHFNEEDLQFEYKGRTYSYMIPFGFEIYRLFGGAWQPIKEAMWIGDVSNDSVLDIFGSGVDGVIVYSNTGVVLQEETSLKDKGVYKQIAVGFLVSFRMSYDYVMLCLTKEGKITNAIFCYNKCILNEEQTELTFDPINRALTITTSYYGKGNVFFEMFSSDGTSVYKSNNLKNGDVEIVDCLHSFENYTIRFCEKPKGIMLAKNIVLKQFDKTFYAREDFVGRSFKINEVYFNQFLRGEFLEKCHYFNRIYVYFREQLSTDTFLGEVFAQTFRGLLMMNQLNPVEIEICSDAIDGTMDLYMTKDGDGLLLDLEHNGIMNTLDDPKAVDIFSYTIDANGVKAV